ncbi:MAG: hypothetical protein ACK5TA_01575, partial [bacterium]
MGNALVERKWTVRDGLLTASSLRDKTSDTEWLRQPGRQPAPYPGGEPANEKRKLAFTTEKRKLSPVEEECLLVKLVASGVKDTFTYQFQIFPKSAGVNLRFSGGEAPVSPTVENKETQKPDGIE